MDIKIREEIGTRCIIRDDGQRIYDAIHHSLVKGEKVTLDFDGVTQFASPFFNYAIGQLLKDLKKDDLGRLLNVVNIGETGQQVINRVVENASQYHSDTAYRDVVEGIIKQQEEDL